MFGYGSGRELCGKPIYTFVEKEVRKGLAQQVTEVVSKKQTDTFELVILRCDGKKFPTEVTLSGIAEVSGRSQACSLFLRDITVRKKSEENKQAMERQLRAVYKMEALGQMAQGIAHDLNNSLGAISGYADLIEKMGFTTDERLRKYTGMIASATERSAGLIHQLLTFARKGRMQSIPFDANEIIADNISLLKSTMEKNIEIVQELKANPATVVGDPGQLQNAIINLSVNARDAMPSGGTLTIKTDTLHIDENFAKSRSYKMTPGPYLQMTLSDTGCGMDKQTLGHLFEPFFTTKEIGKGTGLGLASVYGTVKSHHGYIEVESSPGHGSTFTLYLPLTKSSRHLAASTANEGGSLGAKRHIMVVDDDQALREMLSELLSWLGYRVTTFADSQESVDYYADHHAVIDLVILDWKMPGLDGIQCARKMREINPHVKVLISTGYCHDEDRQRFLSEGVAGILPKPYVSSELSKAVADILS
jgi:PAS domain S-box-containing protein